MRLIDADALIRDIEHYNLSDGKFQHWVEIQPTIEPERKKGKWIHDNPNTFRCSRCNKYLDISCGNMKMNFCPNCGADMRGEREETK